MSLVAGVGCRKADIGLAVLQCRSASIRGKACRQADHEIVSNRESSYPREMSAGISDKPFTFPLHAHLVKGKDVFD